MQLYIIYVPTHTVTNFFQLYSLKVMVVQEQCLRRVESSLPYAEIKNYYLLSYPESTTRRLFALTRYLSEIISTNFT